jgi:acyl carrier protein
MGFWSRSESKRSRERWSGEHPPDAEAIATWLVANISQRLGVPGASIDPDAPFSQFGLDSQQAVAISGELEEWCGRKLAATLLWDYPTIASLADHVASGAESPPGPEPSWEES